ncbi:hypothetical protein KIPB_012036, partial [Kipferlia bialata]
YEAKKTVSKARDQCAALLGCTPETIIFTSGGTESNNQAIMGCVELFRAKRPGATPHIVTVATEHPAVLEVCEALSAQGVSVTVLPVSTSGMVTAEDVAYVLTPSTCLVCVMLANNESGTVVDIPAISALVHTYQEETEAKGGYPFPHMHVDAAQAVGKVPVSVSALGCDTLSVAGHKLYAPKGVGLLYLRPGRDLVNIMHGAGQEGGRRPGTENTVLIAGLGTACEVARAELGDRVVEAAVLTAAFAEGIATTLRQGGRDMAETCRVNGHMASYLSASVDAPEGVLHALTERAQQLASVYAGGEGAEDACRYLCSSLCCLPNTLSLSFQGVEAEAIISAVSDKVGSCCLPFPLFSSHRSDHVRWTPPDAQQGAGPQGMHILLH